MISSLETNEAGGASVPASHPPSHSAPGGASVPASHPFPNPAPGGASVPASHPASVLLFAIPPCDQREAALSLPHEVQAEVVRTLSYLRRIHAAENRAQETRLLAALPVNQARRGFSAASLTRKYYAYLASGDWRVLIDRAKAPPEKSGLPKAFVPFFQKLCENNQRCCAGGMRELLIIWRTHRDSLGKEVKAIPGYAEWPASDPRTGVPAGWTERNLYRHVPEEFHLTLGRIGRAAASAHRLKVYRTRAGLRLCEFVQFDDHEYNLKINFPGQWKAMRPRGFTAMDVLTSFPAAKSFKPTLWDDAEEKKLTLTESDAMWFVMHFLCDIGYRTDEIGTALCVEWGTMAIRDAFEQRIHDATNGRVRVERSGKFGTEGGGRLAVQNQFKGQAKGNFRFKALIESFWNIIDNYLAVIPGQVGKDRNHSPEQIHGADAYNNKLLKLESILQSAGGASVPASLPHSHSAPGGASVPASLKKPFFTWSEFLDAALACYRAIETTDQHECEGWAKCGFELKEWRLDQNHEWLAFEKLLALPDASRSIAENMIVANPLLTRARRMSRAEAFQSRRHELTPLPAFHWPALMGVDNAVRGGEPLSPKAGVFEIGSIGGAGRASVTASHDTLRFAASDEYGQRLTDKYICFVNPFNPSVLVACDAKLRVKALCNAIAPSSYNDAEGIKKQMGAARSWEARAIQEFQEKHADEIKAKADLHEHNGNLLAGRDLADEPARAQEHEALAALADSAIRKNKFVPEPPET